MRERTIDTASIWDKTIYIDYIHKVLKSIVHDREFLGFNKAFDNQETVQVVLFSEFST